MFRTFASITCVVVLAIIVLHFLMSAVGARGKAKRAHLRLMNFGQVLAYLVLVAGTVLMGITAYIPTLIEGTAMRGWQLVFHCAAAPMFMVGLPAVLLTWAGKYGWFSDYKRAHQPKDENDPLVCFKVSVCSKFWFWAMATAGFVVMATMIVSMLPLFNTHTMETLIAVHKYASLVCAAALLIHAYTLFRPARVVSMVKTT